MAHLIQPKAWERIAGKPIPEKMYLGRRSFVKQLGLAGLGLAISPTLLSSCKSTQGSTKSSGNTFSFTGMDALYPARKNMAYPLNREITAEYYATHYNNFYEFISPDDTNIYNVYKFVEPFDTRDWQIEVTGLAEKTGHFHLGDLIQEMGLEERSYRFRCVERWAMAVPWTGFSLAKLITWLQPKSQATHIRFWTKADAEQMIGVRTQKHYPFPYFEGLRMDEAMNELSFVATGIYGKPLPKQNGAPLRIVVPWKYGYKNPKSIVRIDFIDKEPETFWHQFAPDEYPFLSNVDPEIPHPRWSQAQERMIPDGEQQATLKYNGYGEWVANLYE